MVFGAVPLAVFERVLLVVRLRVGAGGRLEVRLDVAVCDVLRLQVAVPVPVDSAVGDCVEDLETVGVAKPVRLAVELLVLVPVWLGDPVFVGFAVVLLLCVLVTVAVPEAVIVLAPVFDAVIVGVTVRVPEDVPDTVAVCVTVAVLEAVRVVVTVFVALALTLEVYEAVLDCDGVCDGVIDPVGVIVATSIRSWPE